MSWQGRVDFATARNIESSDPESPISYVRAHLDKLLKIEVNGGRQLQGVFVALDPQGNMFFRNGFEFVGGTTWHHGWMCCSLSRVIKMWRV
jgi:small nuclear ribonucleoprotein (snRNP)-like protein